MDAPDVTVLGAGIVGAACAYYLAREGLSVTVVDRGGIAGGTTGAGEGNILVSDKEPGPELSLAVRSNRLWRELDFPDVELEAKGGLVVTTSPAEQEALDALAATQTGVESQAVAPHDVEPHLGPGVTGGRFYPQDMQVQPMLAAAAFLRASKASVRLGTTVTGLARGRVETTDGVISTGVVINAMGVWAGELTGLPVMPRRGFILVTSKVPGLVRHKVYAASYVAAVGSSEADLQMSPVVESTQAGSVLIGSSRERVGFDSTMSLPVLRQLAASAVELFPALANVQVIRAYKGFRPYMPDHLPAIGATEPWLYHACGHEGAGVGLAPVTGSLLASLITGSAPIVDPAPFSPLRFGA
ncbi:NAD(P)/FAD-dependent oxidoreductase [Catelliglobosispora koreensis]|uniref:NAD(P)/FAD-dependent oxidoreductase n=1 Tax=Catelliglobosispora koreensis TaxID=129052 RepID=UPI00035FB8D7|nr:FAD-dependent oxidoreductase [Catelliglobosispora koreensis]